MMTKLQKILILTGVVSLVIASRLAPAQEIDSIVKWTTKLSSEYTYRSNIVYKRANQYDCKLDVIAANDRSHTRPTLVYFHGGGWVIGSKDDALLLLMPYLSKGMDVVNVDYRLASVSLAPAAVEDCRCALRWVHQHARDYGFDLNRIVVSGHSAGGHLSLMSGMLTSAAGFDNECLPTEWMAHHPEDEDLKVAAIVNFFGITDVADVLEGPNRKDYPPVWFGSLPNRLELARQLSPLSYVHGGLPPILTVHGDADNVVPYQQAVRLHAALHKAGVPNQLYTVSGGKHGGFGAEQDLKIQQVVFDFLTQHGVL